MIAQLSACGGGGGAAPVGAASYSVGGSVSGLTGTVVLQDNGVDNLTLTSNGAFTFVTSVADGSAYSVSVLTQPGGQTCSVSTGAGTVSGSNITNVVLVCANNAYSVGGSVSGLTGSIVLQDNNGDNLTVATNGTFTFATQVANGSPYNVTILTQPSNGQKCSVSGGSGTMSATVTSVVVTCVNRAWGTAALIETENLGSVWDPKIVIDTNGNALAVWEQSDGTRYNIWANRYTAGTGWGVAALIETDNVGDAYAVRVAFDAGGNALAVWEQSDGVRFNIWANRYTAGTGWGTAALIETDNAGFAGAAQVAFDNNGNALAVWEQNDGTRYNIWTNRYTAGTGWGTAALIETDNAGSATKAQVAFDNNGNALAVWSQSDGTRFNIWANRYTAGTGWGAAALIETDNAGSAEQPQIEIDDQGNALAVWSQSAGTMNSNNIWANRYTAGTGWGTAALIETDNTGEAIFPKFAFDTSGNALAVWQQFDGTRYNIWSNRYTIGTGWGAAALIEADNAGHASYPQIVFDINGNALAVWSQSDGTRDNIWATRYTAGTGWGTAVLIETDNTGEAINPQIAFDASGNALAVWSQFDGTYYNVWANRLQ